MTHTLVARMDNLGDVLLAGPAVRAVAAGSDRVTLLTGPRGRAAAELLPGVDDLLVWCAPWIDPEPDPVVPSDVAAFVDRLARLHIDRALILTSFHQSPLPLALLLRMAEVPWIGAISEDYPGSLLDLRHRLPDDLPEAERGLSLAEAAGYRLPDGDSGRLAVRADIVAASAAEPISVAGAGTTADRWSAESRYVVVHPSASAPARQPDPATSRAIVRRLAEAGHRVLVTGAANETALTATVAGEHGVDLGGRTDLPGLARLLAGADVMVAPNTGPAHLAAAVGTPVVSLFAPVVPAVRWAPYGVPTVLLGDQQAPCRDSRARICPIAGHPCLSVDPADVVHAVHRLATAADRPAEPVRSDPVGAGQRTADRGAVRIRARS